MVVSEVADSVNALAPVPESATVSAPVGTVELLVTVTLCAVGAFVYPTSRSVKTCVPVRLIVILGVAGVVPPVEQLVQLVPPPQVHNRVV